MKNSSMAMGPPPPRNPNSCSISDSNNETNMLPPPLPTNPNPSSISVVVEETNMNPPKETTSASSSSFKVPMGPPPPPKIIPNFPTTDTTTTTTSQEETQIVVAPEEPPQSDQNNAQVAVESSKKEEEERVLVENPEPKPSLSNSVSREVLNVAVPYKIPPWSEPPSHPFSFEVLKDGLIITQFDVCGKGAYMFGRVDLCDFVLDHPTISRFHAVLQFRQSGGAYLYDLGSTHGTYINKNQVKKKEYTELHVGDVVRFGQSSRLYIFQGPSELMPPERDFNEIRGAKVREEMQDREASLQRAKLQASLADGISWGITEDAIEEVEEDTEEVTWQTFRGQLTERQEKTRDKIIKRTEKIANMKKEIDAIRSKDIAQGGLTQGQQTQIARNEQRISQVLEELESLEETLNESIQESIGARTGKIHGKKKGAVEDEDEGSSDDDEFYDRTKKKRAMEKAGENQSVETADSLLDKKDDIIKKMEEKSKLIVNEKSRLPQIESAPETGDALDAYMTGLSSQLVLDVTTQLQQELSALQSELDRILYLLKIADPTGEAAKKRDSKPEASIPNQPDITSSIKKPIPKEKKKVFTAEKPKTAPMLKEESSHVTTTQDPVPLGTDEKVAEEIQSKTPAYTVTKPKWLGATEDMKMKELKEIQLKEIQLKEAPLDPPGSDDFVDYKDRKKTLESVNNAKVNVATGIEDAAPGLIIRKRKHVEKPEEVGVEAPEISSVETGTAAADAVALLLKHKRGYFASDDEEKNESISGEAQSKEDKKSRRVLGPQRPDFLENNPEYETWVPPKGQSGDGRTSLNDRYGY